jgi:hypothetical protein
LEVFLNSMYNMIIKSEWTNDHEKQTDTQARHGTSNFIKN